MSEITITVDSIAINAKLNQLAAKLNNLQPVLDKIGHQMNENIRLTFRDLKTPDGVAWKQLSPVTVSRRKKNSSVPLNDTGILRNSISYQLMGQAVEIGTNAPQAAMMNFGGTKAEFGHLWGDIPARQFMPSEHLPVTWEQDVIDIIEDYLVIMR